ncbi:Piso0_005440 [Millerozyma farinosa CBS 7064]|uniref:HECT-type E3 ubiquitin transferase n=1 Tax=Pichia sorbitophila (strain ATCC MYA-4447 / BCRC 22081 / CBS 7064 / NBRC 10061 / NRRL Y-12695) TaxID=559304 RepID=G8Y537_PICSO|nr:Piso0_005440 [Millerozyma farinosa CBS 7064]
MGTMGGSNNRQYERGMSQEMEDIEVESSGSGLEDRMETDFIDEEEDDSLQRLSEQARRRRRQVRYFDQDEDDENEEELLGGVASSSEDANEDYDEEYQQDNGEDEEHPDDDEEDDDGDFGDEMDEDIDPMDFLQRLIRARPMGRDRHSSENSDEEPGSSGIYSNIRHQQRADRTNRSDNSDDELAAGHGFADIVQRIVRGGVVFNGFDRDTSEIQNLINNLNQRHDKFLILESLNELCEKLLMMNGITAERTIPANKLASSLVKIMQDPLLQNELDILLVSCRCLYNFLEVNQDFIHDVLNNNAIECLCEKIFEIVCIDLTEQALQTLEMISREPISHNKIVSSNGLKACLQYLDFLTLHAQRKCMTIVANACSNVSYVNFQMIKNVFPDISQVLRSHGDPVVIENGWLAISRIVMSFKLKPSLLESLFLSDILLLEEMTKIIQISSNKSSNSKELSNSNRVPLNFSSCLSLLKSLTVLSNVSVEISRLLLEQCSIGDILVRSVNRSSKNTSSGLGSNIDCKSDIDISNNASIEVLMDTPKELLSACLTLIGYLLPITYDIKDSPFLKGTLSNSKERNEINDSRISLCKEVIPGSFMNFVNNIWSLLINCFQATMDFEIRKKALINITRIISFCLESDLYKIDDVNLLCELLASIINQGKGLIGKTLASQKSEDNNRTKTDEDGNDTLVSHSLSDRYGQNLRKSSNSENVTLVNQKALLLSALAICHSLMSKAPNLFVTNFEKEGLINDNTKIVNDLRLLNVDKSDGDKVVNVNTFVSSYSNNFIDPEFKKNYDEPNSESVNQSLLAISEMIESLYLSEKSAVTDRIPKHMKSLEEIKNSLEDVEGLKLYDFCEWKNLWTKFKNSIIGENDQAQVSSFELISSGILSAFSKVFNFEETNFSEYSECHKAFLRVFFLEHSLSGTNTSPAFLLVSKLQEALTRAESFDIISSGGTQPLSNDNHQASSMAKQVKLRFSVDPTCRSQIPEPMQHMILSVHAIATFKSIESFIRQRLRILEEMSSISINGDNENSAISNTSSSSNEKSDNKAKNGSDSSFVIEFLNNGETIPLETTIYGAVYRSLQSKVDEVVDPTRVWSSIHDISFRITHAEITEPAILPPLYCNAFKEIKNFDSTTLDVLNCLRALFEMNNFTRSNVASSKAIRNDVFMNWKLTVKLNRQLEEPLIVASGTLPGWCISITRMFPFLFPLDTRIFFLQSTSFGYSRLIHQWQLRTNQENNEHSSNRFHLGRPTRHKVRISRKSMLQSAVKVLGMYGSSPGIFEIEYFDEVGSGLGPTLEFYAVVSREFSRKKLKLWRDESDSESSSDNYVVSFNGLFPSPLHKTQLNTENGRKVLFFFQVLGKFVARALLDSRILDLRLNPLFLRIVQVLSSEDSEKISKEKRKGLCNLSTLKMVDPKLARSIEHLLKYVDAYSKLLPEERESHEVDGCTLEDLSLYFVLPGYPKYELIQAGENVQVDSKNIEVYINKVLDATLFAGVASQVQAFAEGFSTVFPISSLCIFSPEELAGLFGSSEEDWSYETLLSSMHANHGYSKDSDSFKRLLNILGSFNDVERRCFLQFLTGSPRLPIGGFKALRPEFTVVKKSAENGLKDDDYLPSVMTCANYLKLPNYSSQEVMKVKLLQAVKEGADAFLLS